jgi:beta-galactosidase
MWAWNEWKRYGLIEPQWKLVSFHAQQVNPTAVRVTAALALASGGSFHLSHTASYTIYGDGSIAVDNCVVPQGKKIPFARLGVRLLLDQKLDQFAFLGRGPMENYADRKRGFDVGVFATTVRGNMTPYAKPMECGNHEDVRWAALTGNGLPGLMAQAEAGGVLQASALPYTDEQMDPVEYTVDLPPSKASVLVLGARTTGVGSNGCGPRPADEYIVWSQPASFSYVLRLLPAGADVRALGRVQAPANRVQPVLATRDWDGKVTLTCATPNAKIQYQLAGGTLQTYAEPFTAPDARKVVITASAAGMLGFTGEVPLAPLDPRARWKATASSFEKGEGEPGNAMDGQSGTFWHSRWSGTVAEHPHWLKIDFGKTINIAAINYLPRQGGNSNGRVKNYELYVSTDGKQWGQPVAKGAFKGKEKEQTVKLAQPATGRYLKLVALSEAQGQKFASVAELDVVEGK